MKRILITLFIALAAAWATEASAFHHLPTVYITTPGGAPILSRTDWTEGATVRIAWPDGTEAYASRGVAIRGRGHSTFAKPKKPYALRLPEGRGLLGMPRGRRWVLLANFMDHSHVRNRLALAVARQTSLAWTPDCRFVDVVVNGRPQGCYLLCQQPGVGRRRLDIAAPGSFLLEADAYADAPADAPDSRLTTPWRGLPIRVRYPKHPSARQLERITRCLHAVERLLYAPGAHSLATLYRRHIDITSFADWWIVHELTQNAEPNGPRSCYFYKKEGERLMAGPVWDFDLAFIPVGVDSGGDLRPARLGRTDVRRLTVDSLYNARALWYDRLWADTTFRAVVWQRWQALRPRFAALADRLPRWRALIEPSAHDDERLWGGQDPARFDTCATFDASFRAVERTYRLRLERLDTLLASPSER